MVKNFSSVSVQSWDVLSPFKPWGGWTTAVRELMVLNDQVGGEEEVLVSETLKTWAPSLLFSSWTLVPPSGSEGTNSLIDTTAPQGFLNLRASVTWEPGPTPRSPEAWECAFLISFLVLLLVQGPPAENHFSEVQPLRATLRCRNPSLRLRAFFVMGQSWHSQQIHRSSV